MEQATFPYQKINEFLACKMCEVYFEHINNNSSDRFCTLKSVNTNFKTRTP